MFYRRREKRRLLGCDLGQIERIIQQQNNYAPSIFCRRSWEGEWVAARAKGWPSRSQGHNTTTVLAIYGVVRRVSCSLCNVFIPLGAWEKQKEVRPQLFQYGSDWQTRWGFCRLIISSCSLTLKIILSRCPHIYSPSLQCRNNNYHAARL